jgi:hypothetical protein
MDYVTRQFINLTKKLRKDLNKALPSLQRGIEKISTKIESAAAKNHTDHQKASAPPPVILGELRRPQSEIDQEEAREIRKEASDTRQEGRDRIRLFFEGSGLLIASVLAVANIGLWLVTKEVSNATRDAAAAANSQVQASKDSIDATVKQFRLDQRAWLGPKGITLHEMHAPEPIVATITIMNFGKTPAMAVSARYYLHASDVKINARDYARHPVEPPPTGISPTFILLPNATMDLVPQTGTTDNLGISSVNNGKKFLYAFAWINYRDVFGEPHQTKFCALYDARVKTFSTCEASYDSAD